MRLVYLQGEIEQKKKAVLDVKTRLVKAENELNNVRSQQKNRSRERKFFFAFFMV